MKKKAKRKSPSKTVRTFDGIAALIRAKFGISCDRMKIKNWQTRWKSSEPFPRQGHNNEFVIADCFAWVEKNIIKGKSSLEPDLFEKAQSASDQKKILALEREQFEFDRDRGLYILKDVAYQTTVAALTLFKAFVREEIEKRAVVERREKLKAMGVKDELATEFFVWDKQCEIEVIDAIEKRCQQEAEGKNAISI